MIADLNTFSAKLNKKGTLMNDLVTDTSIVPDLKATMESLRATSANTQALTKEFSGITNKLNSKDNSLGMLLNDPEFAKSLKKTIENADSASYNLNKGIMDWYRNGFPVVR
jgi:phospholipid/cholesterol/gamma-HCH transport system substrate-binding protein